MAFGRPSRQKRDLDRSEPGLRAVAFEEPFAEQRGPTHGPNLAFKGTSQSAVSCAGARRNSPGGSSVATATLASVDQV